MTSLRGCVTDIQSARFYETIRASKINGWMTLDELIWLYDLGDSHAGGAIVEVGSWMGRSLYAIAAGMKWGRLWAVDNMSGKSGASGSATPEEQEDGLYSTLWQIKKAFPDLTTSLIPMASVDAARDVFARGKVELDAVFIDGDHRREHVTADIKAWGPLVRHGGEICGHDYPEVGKAVDEQLPDAVVVANTIWSARKA